MKKTIFGALIVVLLLTGCESGKVLKCSFKDKDDNMNVITTSKYTFDKEGKKVKKINTIIEYTINEEYLKQQNIDINNVLSVESICDSYKTVNNTSCKSSTKDNKITIEINYKEDKNNTSVYNGDYKFFKNYFEGQKYECK